MAILLFIFYFILTLIFLYRTVPAQLWIAGSIIYLFTATFVVGLPWVVEIILWVVVIALFFILQYQPLRDVISDRLFEYARRFAPSLSKTEEEALNTGDTWVEQDIFTGTPDWDKLSKISTQLTTEEQAFLDNETHELCAMLDTWEIQQNHDLPTEVWAFLKEKGFFGLVIAKEYEGKGFSARAHSDIVLKIASRSGVAAVTVMVPNSLGPGELIHHYGTDAQKAHYLPRLAKGIDIPCFALTEPEAGSDATSIQSEAIVVEKEINGQIQLGLNLQLNKRWITLAPVATLIGLAVLLKDPHHLLQGCGMEGITCLLIPHDVENLEIGNRHLPANQPFMNGTIRGKDIFVPITSIIGGQSKAGQGWQMLVECLSIGRSISLPSLAAASSAVAYLTTGAFARIRRQFHVEIVQFEGVQEKLAAIAGLTYLVNATRLFTLAAVNQGKKPSVASGITKYFNTELARTVIIHAMDVHAGRTVVVGPRNYLIDYYQSLPISITVEGANIMSRNLLIFGQGSMACHPYLREEFYAMAKGDNLAFRKIVWQHITYFMRNFAKTLCSGWTGGFFITVPRHTLKKQYKRLARLSYAFAWFADVALICLGGQLKRKERLSARLADALSYLYLAMAALRFFQQSPASAEEKLHAQWALTYCFHHAQKALIEFCHNFPSRPLGMIIRFIAFPWGQTMHLSSDALDQQLAKSMTHNHPYREHLKHAIYLSGDATQPVDRMEHALQSILSQEELLHTLRDLSHCSFSQMQDALTTHVSEGRLTQEEMDKLLAMEKARWNAIQVDEFAFAAMQQKTFTTLTEDY